MRGVVSVDQAVKRGKILLVFIPAAIILGSIFGATALIMLELIEGWMLLLFLVGSILVAWLYWSYSVTAWRIWAFENVRNVHHLKTKAIRNKLIWEEGSFFEKTEIRNQKQKQKLHYLEKKFLQKDVFHDDSSVPKETAIYYSKVGNWVGTAMSVGAIGFGVYFLQQESGSWYPLVFIAIGVFFAYTVFKKMRDTSPQLVLNANGVRFNDGKLIPWLAENREEFRIEGSGKNAVPYFTVFHNGRYTEIAITDLGTSLDKLEKLAQVYRLRYEKNHA